MEQTKSPYNHIYNPDRDDTYDTEPEKGDQLPGRRPSEPVANPEEHTILTDTLHGRQLTAEANYYEEIAGKEPDDLAAQIAQLRAEILQLRALLEEMRTELDAHLNESSAGAHPHYSQQR